MRFESTPLPGVHVVQVEPIADHRGFFARAWSVDEFRAQAINTEFVDANLAHNPQAGTLRGMHFQRAPHEETKLVRCTRGRLYDVAVDLRPGSRTRGQWFGIELSADEANMLVIPEGCAHGYLTLEQNTDLLYHTTHRYAPSSATGVRYDDPSFGIDWPRGVVVVSEQDRGWPLWSERSEVS